MTEPKFQVEPMSLGSKLVAATLLLTFVGFIVAGWAYAFHRQNLKHEEKMQEICLSRGVEWRDGSCDFSFLEK